MQLQGAVDDEPMVAGVGVLLREAFGASMERLSTVKECAEYSMRALDLRWAHSILQRFKPELPYQWMILK